MKTEIRELCVQNLARQMGRICRGAGLADVFAQKSARWNAAPAKGSLSALLEKADRLSGSGQLRAFSPELEPDSIFHLLFRRGNGSGSAPSAEEEPPKSAPVPDAPQARAESRRRQLEALLDALPAEISDAAALDVALDACEETLSGFPSGKDDLCLSAADAVKYSTALCAALGAGPFGAAEPLLLTVLDLSGIQSFLYTISGKGALKLLRSRSFYLDLLMAHLVRRLLSAAGMPVVNLMYMGGGRAYLLLPNTEEVRTAVENGLKNVNGWILDRLETSLYVANGQKACSPEELFQPAVTPTYRALFSRLSRNLADGKVSRYGPAELRALNGRQDRLHGRECRICSRSDAELDADGVCPLCREFLSISAELANETRIMMVTDEPPAPDLHRLPLPCLDGSTAYFCLPEPERARALEKMGGVEFYHRGGHGPGLALETGAQVYTPEGGEPATFEELAGASEGIPRIAVLRADVDNLGLAFMKGFDNAPDGFRPFLLTSALSRELSRFFKRELKKLTDAVAAGLAPEFGPASPRLKLHVVYAGGDDLFAVGAWNDVLTFSMRLQQAFRRFTAGALSLSAGVGLYDAKFPLQSMAEETAVLEDAAKSLRAEKNAVALFGLDVRPAPEGGFRSEATHGYPWEVFTKRVIGEKFRSISEYFDRAGALPSGGGQAFLYRLRSYVAELQQHPEEKINLARFAYLLSRLAPADGNREQNERYHRFSSQMYRWIFQPEDRRQILTAMTLYVYLKRSVDSE